SLLVTMCIGLSNFIWLPVMGAFSDRIGRKPLLLGASALALLTAYPALSWLVREPSFAGLQPAGDHVHRPVQLHLAAGDGRVLRPHRAQAIVA
ncbi:hypothetical protein ACLXAZ_33330, partial [Escherichia coli]